MPKRKNRKLSCLFTLLLCVIAVYGQYSVSGGTGEPLLAADNTLNRIQVWLVYGMEGVKLSYTSAGSSHKWYRYKERASDAEAVTATVSGDVSTVNNPEEGYGYFVLDGDNYAMSNFVWIMDYSRYPVDIHNLRISDNVDPCELLRFSGDDATVALTYRTPSGVATEIKREYEISYMTQVWNDNDQRFTSAMEILTIEGNPIGNSFKPPLDDTEIQLTGDLFARHFGVEKTYSTGLYNAVALEVHADTLVLSDGGTNMRESGSEALAPADMRFTAYANTPVASLFIWQIARKEDPDKPLVRFTEPEMEYTFSLAGDYIVQLEVSDRTGVCTNTEYTYNISVTETVMLIPNAFTPEGSPGVNDEFKVVYRSVVRFKASVFNRWGQELFRWTDPSRGWDGKYRGKLVPAGAYYYVIEYTGTDGKTHKKSGDINVIRNTKTKGTTTGN
ncbi:MAG: gliding motility-associated C-terminal domain-containing protein [Tannerella sp.]|jgi:gliding motility-associated-like protein|nr:gliding motility-associated C-terminal domain-containing protein [Tannerella sp.]